LWRSSIETLQQTKKWKKITNHIGDVWKQQIAELVRGFDGHLSGHVVNAADQTALRRVETEKVKF
jgi:hypothetical protein